MVERLVRHFAPGPAAEALLREHRGMLEQLVMQVHLECAMLVAEAHGQVSPITHMTLGPHASEAVHNVITNLAGRVLARAGMEPTVLPKAQPVLTGEQVARIDKAHRDVVRATALLGSMIARNAGQQEFREAEERLGQLNAAWASLVADMLPDPPEVRRG
jgi:hypothetical protein